MDGPAQRARTVNASLPPSLPPKSPLRALRATASLTAMATATPGAGNSLSYSLLHPLPPLPTNSATPPSVVSPRSSLTRSLSARSVHDSKSSSSRRPSTASSITSAASAIASSPVTTGSLSRVASESSLAIQPTSPLPTDRDSQAPMDKRAHALTELLTSERVYASDLALMRHIHIPLALGQPSHFQVPSSENPEPSESTITRSPHHPSASSNTPAPARTPMSPEDVRVIFSNIEELAIFADTFAERIEAAIGDTLDMSEYSSSLDPPPSRRADKIGELFLHVAPIMKQLYTTYITRHPLALSRLTNLTTPGPNPDSSSISSSSAPDTASPPRDGRSFGITPEMKTYLADTRAMTERHTHAWDLPSLLIKPVQRLLKYPLLLQSIIQPTQQYIPDHPDLPALIKAKDVLETVARDVNEARRRWEVVKAVLEGYGFGPPGTHLSASSTLPAAASASSAKTALSFARNFGTGGKSGLTKRPSSAGQGASTSPSAFGMRSRTLPPPGSPGNGDMVPNPLSRIQSLKTKLKTSFAPLTPSSPDAAEEAHAALAELIGWESRLKNSETVLRNFFRLLVVDWSRSVRDAFLALGGWGVRFGRMMDDHITTNQPRPDDAVQSFVDLIKGLMELWTDLDQTLQSTLHPIMTSLLGSLARPLTLVQHSIALHPLHLQHLSTPYIKTRSPYLLSSSKTFLALQAQLRAEVPTFLELFDRGFGRIILKASTLQARFWEECWTRWSLFALGVGVYDSRMNVPSEVLAVTDDGTSSEQARRASAYSSSASSSRFLSAASSLPDGNAGSDEPETLRLFRERWDNVDRAINDLSIVQRRLYSRMSASSSTDVRSSATSSMLAASYDVLSAIGGPNAPSQPTQQWSPEAVSPSLHNRSRSNTASSPAEDLRSRTRSETVTSTNSSIVSPREWNAVAAFDVPSSVNAPPLSPKEKERKDKKKAEKAEKAAAIKLVQERAKTEKEAEKQRGKTSKARPSTSSSFLAGGVFFPGFVGGSLLSPGLPRSASTVESEVPRRGSKDKGKGVPESMRRQSDSSDRRNAPDNGELDVAQRAKDVLFGLMPPPLTSVSAAPLPALPTLEQMSPTSLSPQKPLRVSDAPSLVRHPYTFGGQTPSPASPISGEFGLWESLFDASQQSYRFQPQPSSPSDFGFGNYTNRRPSQASASDFGAFDYASQISSHLDAATSSLRRSSTTSSFAPVLSPHLDAPIQPRYSDPEPPIPEHETLYIVTCVHPFHPPPGTKHLGLPFLTLEVGDVVDVLLEDGHPSTHENLPIYVDDGDDCMLVGRDERENIGWCLASFVMPLV